MSSTTSKICFRPFVHKHSQIWRMRNTCFVSWPSAQNMRFQRTVSPISGLLRELNLTRICRPGWVPQSMRGKPSGVSGSATDQAYIVKPCELVDRHYHLWSTELAFHVGASNTGALLETWLGDRTDKQLWLENFNFPGMQCVTFT